MDKDKDIKAPPVSEIGPWWPNHPWVALNPEYKGRVYSPIQDCSYNLDAIVKDKGTTYRKRIGEVAMNTRGQIHGMFWLADRIPPQQKLDIVNPLDALERSVVK